MRIGGLVAMYSNRYGSNAGWTKTSLKYRDAASGGLTWTSQYAGVAMESLMKMVLF